MADEAQANTKDKTTETATGRIEEIEVGGHKFKVDTDRLDDVESLEFIERIEHNGQVAAVLPLLKFIMGEQAFEELKAAYIKQDAAEHKKAHPKDKDYTPRMRTGKLTEVYLALIDKFNPKG